MGIENERWIDLVKESTVELVQRIVEDSDRLALRVLLETRKLFRLKDEPPLLLPTFLLKCRDRMAPPDEKHDINDAKLADCIYDLTLAKYSNLPDAPEKTSNPKRSSLKATRVDCRYYYRAFLRETQWQRDQGKIMTQTQEEFNAGVILQKLVRKHFLLSKLECLRDSPFSVRYTWKVEGGELILWYPSYMTAKEFRQWLEENIKDADPTKPGERMRIQALINEDLPRGHHVSLDVPGVEKTADASDGLSLLELHEGFAFIGSLADAVAQEKARNIHKLRPAIMKLGKRAVERLVLQIFTDLAQGEYELARYAQEYGVSKSTLSRFAGNRWFEKVENTETVKIPDLWKNTAKILSENPVFVETVIRSGVAGRFEEVLEMIGIKEDS